jgi:hypothetical protein
MPTTGDDRLPLTYLYQPVHFTTWYLAGTSAPNWVPFVGHKSHIGLPIGISTEYLTGGLLGTSTRTFSTDWYQPVLLGTSTKWYQPVPSGTTCTIGTKWYQPVVLGCTNRYLAVLLVPSVPNGTTWYLAGTSASNWVPFVGHKSHIGLPLALVPECLTGGFAGGTSTNRYSAVVLDCTNFPQLVLNLGWECL